MDDVSTFADTGLSAEQESVMAAIDDFTADYRRQVFVLHGLAGTGKTTLLAHVAHQYDHATLTGKAANVLREKTGLRAGTIHGYFNDLLKSETDAWGRTRLSFAPRHIVGELSGDLVLLEASVVGRSIGRQLVATGAKVIAAGDRGWHWMLRGKTAQLPRDLADLASQFAGDTAAGVWALQQGCDRAATANVCPLFRQTGDGTA